MQATLLDAIESHVTHQANHPALTYKMSDGTRYTRTYSELIQNAKKVATHLMHQCSPGERALLMYPHGIDFIEAFLGCLYAGVIAVPAYPPWRNRNSDRVIAIARDCTARLFLCSSDSERNVRSELSNHFPGSNVVVTNTLATTKAEVVATAISPSDIAFLQYTSGSTSLPKGVVVTHGNIFANEAAIQTNWNLTPNDVGVSWLPMFHDMGLIGGILQPLFVGCHSVLFSPSTFLRDPLRWLRIISDWKATFSGGPNFAYELCCNRFSSQQAEGLDLSRWTAFNGSEPVRSETLKRFLDTFSPYGFRSNAFLPCYGMAETTLLISGGPAESEHTTLSVSRNALEANRIELVASEKELIGCGRVARGLQVRIVDPETGTISKENQIGEIWVSGTSVSSGYWQQPDITEDVFGAKIVGEPDDSWLRTGDLGFIHHDEVFITGRLKDLIIIRGRNIYPQDVENFVSDLINLREPNACAAFATTIDGEERITIAIECSRVWLHDEKSEPLEERLKSMSHEAILAIASKFEVPVFQFLWLRPSTFPRTSSGKVARKPLEKAYLNGELQGSIVSMTNASGSSSESTRGHEIEATCDDSTDAVDTGEYFSRILSVIAAWHHDHDLPKVSLSADTKITSLGIDSLAAEEICLKLERVTGKSITVDAFYQNSTLGQLSAQLSPTVSPSSLGSHSAIVTGTRTKALERYKHATERFRNLERSGYSFFGTEIESQHQDTVMVGEHTMLMLASYSYRGLINHPEINQATKIAIDQFGTGAHGVRLLAGTVSEHRKLEREIADFLMTDDSIVFSSGFVTNIATISSLVGHGDLVVGDEYNHASIADGCRFSGATFKTFDHNSTDQLERVLASSSAAVKLVVVDAVYSMDGDIAPLPEIIAICRRHDALLMVDEAHSLGVIGKTGRGIQEFFNLEADAIDIKMGTLSKTIASCGGYIAAKQEIIDFLRFNARGYIFSAALPAPQVAAARASLEVLRKDVMGTEKLESLRQRFCDDLRELGYHVPPSESAIIPIIFSSEDQTLEAVKFCRERKLFVVPVFYPAVPMDKPRIRATVTSSMSEKDIAFAVNIFRDLQQHLAITSVNHKTGGGGGDSSQ